MKKIQLPLTNEIIQDCHAGDAVLLSGEIYTARDAAHKRLVALMDQNDPLPFDLKGAVIYYAGPCPKKPGQIINSCGPTTSGRMDKYAPRTLERGLKGFIGKGPLAPAVIDAMKQQVAVYFIATGGAGALIAQCVTKAEPIAFEDLGAEAILRLTVKDLPVIVGIDCYGENLYEIGPRSCRGSEK